MHSSEVYTAIGLMSGTSLDGVDVALLRSDGGSYVEALAFQSFPYDEALREVLRACFGRRAHDEAVKEAEALLTGAHIEAVASFGHPADVIGFHGQTLTHDPAAGFTWQIGDGALLARETGMEVVCDFRSADVKAGGQGAPLVPLYHQALAAPLEKPLAILNLGGVGNMTYLGEGEALLAFDTGPGNALIDDFVKERLSLPYDKDGALALQGQADEARLAGWLSEKKNKKSPPKSLDRQDWDVSGVAALPDAAGACTLTEFTVRSVLESLKYLPARPKRFLVTGGGRKNKAIMEGLRRVLDMPVAPVEEVGWNGDALEAEGFAYLAVRAKLGLPLTLPETTGVKEPLSGGVFYKP